MRSARWHPATLALLLLCTGLLPDAAYGSALPKLSISDVTVSEVGCNSQVAIFTVSISAPFGKNVTVQFSAADGTAIAGTDYTAVRGTLSFPRGSKVSKTITVPIMDVLVPGPNKTFYLNLSNPVNATLSKSQGAGTIQAPTVAKCQSCGLSCDDGDACTIDSCSATLGCKHVNGSAADKPYCALSGNNGPPDPNFAACNASGAWIDSDGDGFSDAEEIQGYIDVNGNGVYDTGIDVPLPGADPHKPDVYLHYDYFYASDHDHNPQPEAIQWIVDAFAAQGVNLHVDPVHNAINESTAKVVTLANPIDPACAGPSATNMAQLRQTYFPPNFNLVYHYMAFSHWNTCDSTSDCNNCSPDPECGGSSPPAFGTFGTGEIFGDDAIVSFGTFSDQGVPIPANAVSGVTMHELGHNLGLFHGGPVCDNFKPNYLSVMNYSFYTTGIAVGAQPGDTSAKSCGTDADCTAPAHCSATTNTCFRIDYSSAQLLDLNEAALDETKGLNGSPTSTDISTFTIDGLTPINVPTNGTPIDWNRDGTIETNAVRDINGDGSTTLLTGSNDWAHLNFSFQCSPNLGNDSPKAASRPRFEQLFQQTWLTATRSQPAGSSPSNTVVRVVGASGQPPTRRAPAIDWLKERLPNLRK